MRHSVRLRLARRAQFVALWNAADSPREVAERMGISVNAACCRAWWFRRQGETLRNFRGDDRPFAEVVRCECGEVVFGRDLVAHRSECQRIPWRGVAMVG